MAEIAAYVRRSTDDQTDSHQLEAIRDWATSHDIDIADIDIFSEQASGADSEREAFGELVDEVEAGEFDTVVVWEISRIARRGLDAQRFFAACEESDTVIEVTDGAISRIEPDGTNRMIADIIASVAAQERRALIRRTEAGLERARAEGKWIGAPPTGYIVHDGRLAPNQSPDYEAGETGYLDVVHALEAIDDGASYRATASETPNVTRQTLAKIDQDDELRARYLEPETVDDDRIPASEMLRRKRAEDKQEREERFD
ncbi:recombinase family protein [Halorubrum ezzemoulense]|uniref:Resolvase n=1 Tax=Halorubrum ezzemoulense TaxID=337243 RepID=A0A256JSJ3_HALEZ|nr:recombinase family protein [Halorubrum ezzemoulense]OYR71583.1 resolvase [Halorubrum ezzemoulense]